MNKHNIIEMHDYKRNKQKVKLEQSCFSMLDKATKTIYEMELYVKSFNDYVEIMVKNGNVKKSFANNLKNQVGMMLDAASKEINRRRA